MKVLVVEDSPTSQEVIRELLGKGFELKFETTKREGEHTLRNNKFDAAMLDLNLPDASGIEAVDYFRKIDPKLPIVVITGMGEGPEIDALKAGANEYLIKGTFCHTSLCRSLCRAMERQGKKFEECPLRETCMQISESVEGGCPLYDPMMRKLDIADEKIMRLETLMQDIKPVPLGGDDNATEKGKEQKGDTI